MPDKPQTKESAELEQHPYPTVSYKAKMSAKVFLKVEGSTQSKINTISLSNINEQIDRDVSLSVLEDILSLQKNQVYRLFYTDIDDETSPHFANEYRVS